MIFKRRISSFLKRKLDGLNDISDNIYIPPDCYIFGSIINGSVEIQKRTQLHKVLLSGSIRIGSNTSLWGPNIEVLSKINSIFIGKFCSIGKNTSILEYNHKTTSISSYHINKNIYKENQELDIYSKGSIIVGHDVWIGMNASILTGVKIGHGAIIAAGSIVNTDVPDYAIVAGSPAQVIKYRFSEEIISRLLEINWWDWSLKRIELNKKLFMKDMEIKDLENIS